MRKILVFLFLALGLAGMAQTYGLQNNNFFELVLVRILTNGNGIRQTDLIKSRIQIKNKDNFFRPIANSEQGFIKLINNKKGIYSFRGPKISQVIFFQENKPFMMVEQMPRFPGGDEGLYEWLLKNTPYPILAREKGITGTVIVQFTVDRTGVIKDVHVVQNAHPLLDDAAMETVKKMPNWSAGKQNGKEVSVLINLPFRFAIK